ncbi:MAG: aminotransferase class V-fold PLP-dependent enzyme, partial [Planctomycetota bacterium]
MSVVPSAMPTPATREATTIPDWRALRAQFPMAEQCVYLDGNSLGLCSNDAADALHDRLREWQQLGIGGWTSAEPPWLELSREVAAGMAKVVGAAADRVWAGDTTTLMLHQMLATLWRPRPGRDVVLMEGGAFPTDAYAVQSHQRLRGLDPAKTIATVAPRGDVLEEDDLIAAMDRPDVGCIVLPAIIYTTGQWLDMPRLTAAARERGQLLLWDCSHAAGAVPLDLAELDCDGAFWCGYKYLNGGPGAVAGGYL